MGAIVDTLNDDDGWGWTITVTGPDVRKVYRLPQALDPTDDEDGFAAALVAARSDAGMAEDADPLFGPWQVSAGQGKPHSSESGTVVDWSEGVPA
jgi:hypothetical protein